MTRRRAFVLGLMLAALPLSTPAFGQDGEGEDEYQRQFEIHPYIEVAQVLLAELSPGDEVTTYTSVAAGVDMNVNGRNSAAAVSLRYEREIGWEDDAPDGDIISGIARASVALVPQTLSLEAGGLATRTRVEGNGASVIGPIYDEVGESNLYAAYGGPTLTANSGAVDFQAQYMLGYTRVEEPDALVTAPGTAPIDIFDESVTHNATARVGSRPDGVLPVGVGVGAGWYREDISNLDQRVEDRWVRADVTVPLSPTFALVGGVGYEDVEISSRDALLDSNGDPIIGSDGRLVTDPNSPRVLAYDVEGIIWDVGVLWRPSRRTSLEAHVGRRYGSTTFYGTLSYAPSERASLNVSVYDNVVGYGGMVTRVLDDLPTEFTAARNPLTGDLGLCVASLDAGSCLGGVLGGVRSSTFHSSGVMANFAYDTGRTSFGIGAGYDRRKYIAAEGTVLESADGLTDETLWAMAYVGGLIDERSSWDAAAYGNWFQSGFDLSGSTASYGASAAYHRDLLHRLTATLAVSIDGVSRDAALEDLWAAAALLGLRYTFF